MTSQKMSYFQGIYKKAVISDSADKKAKCKNCAVLSIGRNLFHSVREEAIQ